MSMMLLRRCKSRILQVAKVRMEKSPSSLRMVGTQRKRCLKVLFEHSPTTTHGRPAKSSRPSKTRTTAVNCLVLSGPSCRDAIIGRRKHPYTCNRLRLPYLPAEATKTTKPIRRLIYAYPPSPASILDFEHSSTAPLALRTTY